MSAPERNTIWRFGERLGVDEQLHRHGYIAQGDQAIDAALVSAPCQRIGQGERDKLSVSVDHQHGFIRGASQRARQTSLRRGALSTQHGHRGEADKAYPNAQRSEILATLGFKDDCSARPRRQRLQKRCNHRIANRRARVEHVLAPASL